MALSKNKKVFKSGNAKLFNKTLAGFFLTWYSLFKVKYLEHNWIVTDLNLDAGKT